MIYMKYNNSFFPTNIYAIQKTRASPRSVRRASFYRKIEENASPFDPSCERCIKYKLSYLCLQDHRCFACVRSGVESSCDAKMPTRTDKALKEQKAALRKAQSEAADAVMKVVRLQKIIDRLKSKSRAELDEFMEEIEKENEGSFENRTLPSQTGEKGNKGNS